MINKVLISGICLLIMVSGCRSVWEKDEKAYRQELRDYKPPLPIFIHDMEAIPHVIYEEDNNVQFLSFSVTSESVIVDTGSQPLPNVGKGIKYFLQQKDGKWKIVSKSGWIS